MQYAALHKLHRQLYNICSSSPRKFFETKLIRFEQISLDLGNIWMIFEQIWLDLC